MSGYDIIGDIHGHARELIELFERLGYSKESETYRHPQGRTPVFLGDFIDRGTENRAVLEIVMPMVQEGHALAVMGNHEYNAICYHTRHPKTGEPLRPRGPKSYRQHKNFLAEFPADTPATQEVIRWFQTLPIFLELPDGFRVIHACWHEPSLTGLRRSHALLPGNRLDQAFLIRSSQDGTEERDWIEILLKGPELKLPGDAAFQDKDGNPRHHVREKWWRPDLQTYRDIADTSESQRRRIPADPLPQEDCYWYPAEAPPVIFGHYWRRAGENPIHGNAVCVDLSVGQGGHLACYRMPSHIDGAPGQWPAFAAANLIMVKARPI